jgi:hypothetical protein
LQQTIKEVQTQPKDFAVSATISSISGLLPSLDHPLATVRHRMGVGPEKGGTSQQTNKTTSVRTGTNTDFK